jgi:outer membrane protein
VLALPACKNAGNKNSTIDDKSSTIGTSGQGAKIAYVNIDTLEANYEYLKVRREELKNQQDKMESDLQHSYQKMQNEQYDIQKKAQSQSLSPSEYQAAEKTMLQMQQTIESSKQSMTDQLIKAHDDLSTEVKRRIDSFLTVYNKDKHYDYILSYSARAGSPVMYANKQYDVTKNVVEGMNKAAKGDLKK